MWWPDGVGDVMEIMRKLKGFAEFKANVYDCDDISSAFCTKFSYRWRKKTSESHERKRDSFDKNPRKNNSFSFHLSVSEVKF